MSDHPAAPPRKLVVVEFIKDKFIFDPNRSGLYWDIDPLPRGAGTQADLNERINLRNRRLKGIHTQDVHENYMCGLLLLEAQVAGLGEKWRQAFAGKTILMVFKPGIEIQEVSQMRVEPWKTVFTDFFLWSSPKKVYTYAFPDNLTHRFRVVKKEVVDAYTSPIPAPLPDQPDPTPDPSDPPVPPVIVAGNKYVLKGTVGDKAIDLTLEIE